MADEQIEQIVATMMTLKVVDESVANTTFVTETRERDLCVETENSEELERSEMLLQRAIREGVENADQDAECSIEVERG